MAEQVIKNNVVDIAGRIVTGFEMSHAVYGEGFYMCEVEVPRLSDSFDRIPIMVSERLLDVTKSYIGAYVIAQGQFRSYNKHENGHSRLLLSVFVRDIQVVAEPEKEETPTEIQHIPNNIYLDGFICKEPNYRKTPLGREIADVLLAVNRPYNKSDYVPAIAWGRNARYAQNLKIGNRIRIWGRIQSRTYQKKGENQEITTHTAYEVSISKLEIVGEEQEALATAL
jgi:primosomal replication protein N